MVNENDRVLSVKESLGAEIAKNNRMDG